jgi:hypothetical protein
LVPQIPKLPKNIFPLKTKMVVNIVKNMGKKEIIKN